MKVVSTVKTIEEALSLKYYIDFYQREYSWDKDNIESLLEDIYYRFDLSYDVNEEITKDFIKLNYKWYYINTYTVNTIQDRCCLVDGQQRLTTLTLFLIKLYHLANKFSLNNHRISYIQKSICQPHGNGYSFWLGDQNREATLNTLFQNDIVSQNEVSSEYFDESNKTLIVNYLLISKYFNHKFPFDEDDEDKMDSTRSKLEAYIFYLLNNVNLVEINVTDSDDVAMVFEVINAKGQKLKPFEIIKAKLLSKIRKEEIDTYLSLWNDCINNLHKNGLNVDDFFISLLKARYTTTINDLKTGITKDYHKEIFKLKDILDLSKERNVKDFISNVLKNYIKIYVEINSCSSDNTDYPAIYFNTLNKLNNQVLPILSAITVNDIKQNCYKPKLDLVSKLIDRHVSLQKMFNCYSSNKFNTQQQHIILLIRDKSNLSEIKDIVDRQLLKDIKDETMQNEISSIFHYPFFESFAFNPSGDTRIFIKYFFARIESFLLNSVNLDIPREFFRTMVKGKNGAKNDNTTNIEHILADNEENLELFENDRDRFLIERNKIGAILLLKSSENKSSGNDIYSEKLRTYANSNNYLAKTLVQDFYHPTNIEFRRLKEKYPSLLFEPIVNFDRDAIKKRQKLIFEIVKIIWGDEYFKIN